MSPNDVALGNGLLLFFRVDDYDMAVKRARALVDRPAEEPHLTRTLKLGSSPPGSGRILRDDQCALANAYCSKFVV